MAQIEAIPESPERTEMLLRQRQADTELSISMQINVLGQGVLSLNADVLALVERLEALERHLGSGPGSN